MNFITGKFLNCFSIFRGVLGIVVILYCIGKDVLLIFSHRSKDPRRALRGERRNTGRERLCCVVDCCVLFSCCFVACDEVACLVIRVKVIRVTCGCDTASKANPVG